MDDPNRLRRQNEPPMHAAPNSRYMQDSLSGRRSIPATTDRYNRPAPINASPSQGRGIAASGNYAPYNYPDQVPGSFGNPMAPTSAMQYQSTGYGQDGRQQQGFAGYNTMPMGYDNLGGATGAVYDAPQHFQRQPAAAPMLPADVSASYFANDPSNATAASNLPHAPSGGSSAASYHQAASQMPNYSASMSGVSGISHAAAPSADVSMEEPEYPASGALEEKWIEYQTTLRGVFQNIRSRSLESASQSLLDLSNWLLTQVTDLGLNLDDQKLHGDRLKLWEDFNHAWLGLFQAQKDMLLSGHAPQRGQSLVTGDGLEKMGKELTRLCDGIERHGLVDYQYGVWEQQIIDILIQCQDLSQELAGASGAKS